MLTKENLTINIKNVIVVEVIEGKKWHNSETWDVIVRNEEIKRLFRVEEVSNEQVSRLIEIYMPNVIVMMSNAPRHEVRGRIRLANSTRDLKIKNTETDSKH